MAKRPAAKKTGATRRAKTGAAKPSRASAKSKPARAKAAAAKAVPTKKKVVPPKAAPTKRAAVAPRVNAIRELAQRIVDLTANEDDEGSFALYANNVESIEPGMPPAVGIEAIRQKFTMWRGMVSDSAWEARNVWVDGKTIIIEWNARVRLTATGANAELNEVAIHEVENGKIVRERFYYDRAALQPPQAAAQPTEGVQAE